MLVLTVNSEQGILSLELDGWIYVLETMSHQVLLGLDFDKHEIAINDEIVDTENDDREDFPNLESYPENMIVLWAKIDDKVEIGTEVELNFPKLSPSRARIAISAPDQIRFTLEDSIRMPEYLTFDAPVQICFTDDDALVVPQGLLFESETNRRLMLEEAVTEVSLHEYRFLETDEVETLMAVLS